MSLIISSPVPTVLTNTTVAYGRAKTYINSTIGLCITLCMIIVGIYIIKTSLTSSKSQMKVNALVSSISPIGKSYNISFKYTVDNQTYTNSLTSSSYRPVNTYVSLYYDIHNPNNISETSSSTMMLLGSGLITLALCICACIGTQLYMVSKYDNAAIESAITPIGRNRSNITFN